ncbi:Thiolase [Macrophomina phaseolina MS6]|uniref:Thiolase n=2 Tax=Macrophomina phaseolina TaxID=35725 RepID=K2SAX3_MACPH|nr:Thiolase [Macrophomina phaseolina MS6]
MATDRLKSIVSHITPSKGGLAQITQKHPDDVVITLAIRTPLCKGKKGGLKDTPLDGIMLKMLEQVIAKSNLDPALVEDICVGHV